MLNKKSLLSLIVACAMLLPMLSFFGMVSFADGSDIAADGWFESLYAEWKPVSGADGYNAYYDGGAGYVKIDSELIRDYGDHLRVDAVGLTPGNYSLRVVPTLGGVEQSDSALLVKNITVTAYDRSGYAHFNYTEGVGAYNDDGSLKDNAIVLYVTEENKNSVVLSDKSGLTVSGIGNILNSVGQDVGDGKCAKGGLANTNGDILRRIADEGRPLVIRIIGSVTAPEGLTAYNDIDFGGTKGDNGCMARMSGAKNVTIEGIGSDAVIDGWGLHFICQTSDYQSGRGKSFEVRNLAFKNVPEDCVGMEGQQESNTLTAPVERCWIHNCSFYAPVISNPAESDKSGGDGACDFKRGRYFTNSYCLYDGYHKTNLVGSSDDSLQYHITYHHNYWKDCESRGPLARQANIHMYNNVFDGQSSYAMNPRANAYIFSEYNLFFECKNPITIKSGAVKSFSDAFVSCVEDNMATVVTDRTEIVSSANKYASFELNEGLSYIPSGDYALTESIAEMKKEVMAYAGNMKREILSPDEVSASVIPADRYPKAAVVLDYSKSLNSSTVTAKSGIFDNIVFNLSSVKADYVSVGGSGSSGRDIVFYVGCEVNITLTEYSGTKYSAVLCNEMGEMIMEGGGTAYNLPAGFYFIQSAYCNPGKSEYKEAKLSSLVIQATNPGAAVNPMPTPKPPIEDNPDSPGTDTPGTDNPVIPGNPTFIPVGSFTYNVDELGTQGNELFTLTGSLSTGKGTVTYCGMTLTRCLKVSSSAKISFAPPRDGRVTMVFNPSCAGYTLHINGGDAIPIPSDGLVVFDVKAGLSYEVTKGKSESFLYYIVYTPNDIHTHDYSAEEIKAADCTEDGEYLYSCACGESYTETTPATGHNFVDGFCVDCGSDDPDYRVEDNPSDPAPPIDDPDDKPSDDPEDKPDDPATPDAPSDDQEEPKLNFFQRLFKAIADFFRRLFGIKK